MRLRLVESVGQAPPYRLSGMRLVVRNNNIPKHREMPAIERRQRNVPLRRCRSDQGIRQPDTVALAIISAVSISN
jgi:hypothetical protein